MTKNDRSPSEAPTIGTVVHTHRSTRSSRPFFRGLASVFLTAGAAVSGAVGAEKIDRWVEQRRARRELQATAARAATAGMGLEGLRGPDTSALTAPGPAPGSVVARILIPDAGVDAMAFEGVDHKTLKRGAGHFPGTALPGELGNSSFAAHRDSFFRGLREVEVGHRVVVQTGGAEHAYRVSELRVVAPPQVEVVASRGRSELTLVTCYPFDYVGPAPRRFVVHADLLEPRTKSTGAITAALP